MLKEDSSTSSRDVMALREENQSLRDLLRKQEKFIHEQQILNKKSKLNLK
jgi:hypothetical protein